LFFKELEILTAVLFEVSMCVTVPNFVRIAQAVAEMWPVHSIFKMAAVRHLGFFKVENFQLLVRIGGLMCVIMPNFVQIGQGVAEIWPFLYF